MALAADGKGLVPAEGSAHDFIVGGKRLSQALEDLDCCGGGGELGAQMGIGIDHDAAGMNLPGHVADLLGALRYDGIGIVLVELLHGYESAQRLLQPAFLGLVVYLFRHLGGPLGLKLDEIRMD